MTNERKKVEAKDIIGLIKTKERTNSVELKKELYGDNTKKKRFFQLDFDEVYYIFDNTKIPEDKVIDNEYFDDFDLSLEGAEVVDVLNELNDIIDPIRKICEKYNIRLEDVAETLEEYICLDNGEEL